MLVCPEITWIPSKAAATLRRELSGTSLVAMMKAADFRNLDDAPTFWPLDPAWIWSVLGQC
jgi:hypothetical protein